MRDPSKVAVAQLAFCMTMNQTSLSLIMTVAALSGAMLAGESPGLATLPIACLFVGILATTIPASLVMARWGRRVGFAIGAGVGIVAGLLGAAAIWQGELWLLCVGLALYGVAAGFANYYRFAAAEVASPGFRSRAISLVLAGGCIAGVLGPFLAVRGEQLVSPYTYLGSYLVVAALSVLIFPSLLTVRLPAAAALPSANTPADQPARPLWEIVRQRKFLLAVTGAMVGYGSMNLIMVSTPLAMKGCGFVFSESAEIIQWHVLGMYLPSFFTGGLIRRFGVTRIMTLGAAATMAAAAVNISGLTFTHFWAGLVLLGVGWNFLFVGGTTLLTETYRSSERSKAQAANEFLVFGTVALTALSSGLVFSEGGWQWLNLGVLPALAAIFIATLWLQLRRSAAPA
jgi:MFS family permease